MCLHLELHYILENIYLKKFIWSLTAKIIILNSSYKVINGFLIRFMFMNYKREITRLKCQKKKLFHLQNKFNFNLTDVYLNCKVFWQKLHYIIQNNKIEVTLKSIFIYLKNYFFIEKQQRMFSLERLLKNSFPCGFIININEDQQEI